MQIPTIIMAGGKGERFNFDKIKSEYQEKPLLLLGNKYIIEYIIDAALNSKHINRVIVAISPFTPQTKFIINAKKLSIELVETPGIDYHSDISFVIKKLKLGIIMTIVADIPLIKPEIIDEIIDKYFILNKPALSVMADVKLFSKHGSNPTITFQSDDGQKNLVPLGINIIDGRFIEQLEIEQATYISDRVELIYNINIVDDYFQLKEFFNKIEKQKEDK